MQIDQVPVPLQSQPKRSNANARKLAQQQIVEEQKVPEHSESQRSNPSNALRELSIQLKCMQSEIKDLEVDDIVNQHSANQMRNKELKQINSDIAKDDMFIQKKNPDLKVKVPKEMEKKHNDYRSLKELIPE